HRTLTSLPPKGGRADPAPNGSASGKAAPGGAAPRCRCLSGGDGPSGRLADPRQTFVRRCQRGRTKARRRVKILRPIAEMRAERLLRRHVYHPSWRARGLRVVCRACSARLPLFCCSQFHACPAPILRSQSCSASFKFLSSYDLALSRRLLPLPRG